MLSRTGPRWRGSLGLVTVALIAFVSLAWSRPAAAQGRTPSDLTAHLEAGEFGPARAAAEQLPTDDRDQALASIATAQYQAGARGASLATVYDIKSDVSRRSTFDQIRSQGASGTNGGSGSFTGGGQPAVPGARGGGVQADFDSLIELITTTIDPDSWDE